MHIAPLENAAENEAISFAGSKFRRPKDLERYSLGVHTAARKINQNFIFTMAQSHQQ